MPQSSHHAMEEGTQSNTKAPPQESPTTTPFSNKKKVAIAVVCLVTAVAIGLAIGLPQRNGKTQVDLSDATEQTQNSMSNITPLAVTGVVASLCCNRAEEPGMFGNPVCFEGHKCCPTDGKWVCANGGLPATFNCEDDSSGVPCGEDPVDLGEGDECCDPSKAPDGRNGGEICIEGAACCPDGTWACNNGDGSNSCIQNYGVLSGADGRICDVSLCDPDEKPDGRNGGEICIEGASCCPDGTWACNNGDGSNACVVGGGGVFLCDPD